VFIDVLNILGGAAVKLLLGNNKGLQSSQSFQTFRRNFRTTGFLSKPVSFHHQKTEFEPQHVENINSKL
jgi:hypothetical protein